jgi:hypothetical protein
MNSNLEWDEAKAAANRRKHQVGFEEGATVFEDPFLLTFPDPEHSESEERYLNIGYSTQGRLLVVVHAEHNEKIRISSCRKATPTERKSYEEADF